MFLSASRSIVGVARRRGGPDARSCGTGFLWDMDGTVVTNCMPFANVVEFSVFLSDGTDAVEYYRVGADEARDIAVLRPKFVEAVIKHSAYRTVMPLPRTTNSVLRVGQTVYSIGNLFGMQKTFHGGVLSGIGRNVYPPLSSRPLSNVLQTDVLGEKGGMGCILLNSKAELVGLVSSLSSGVQGATFAVTVDDITKVVADVLQQQKAVDRAVSNENISYRTGRKKLEIRKNRRKSLNPTLEGTDSEEHLFSDFSSTVFRPPKRDLHA